VVVGSDDAHVYAWHVDGTVVDGWPKQTQVSVKGSPALANLDDDPALEVIVGDFDGNLYPLGKYVPDTPYKLYFPMIFDR
jgi:hypothetical protein